jgi:uncharacterized integral membrane protein (TIGR00698 family)
MEQVQRAGPETRGQSPFTLPRKAILDVAPGLLLCVAVAVPAIALSHLNALFEATAVSLILGMVLRNVLLRATADEPGISLAIKVFIPAGIILHGTKLDFNKIAAVPFSTTLLVIFVGVPAFFAVTWFICDRLNVNKRTGLLLASGFATCGGVGIIVISRIIKARPHETSMAVIISLTAALIGGVLIYPFLADGFSLSPLVYGVFTGSTLQVTGIVKLAASHMGDTAVSYAIPVKMMRMALLAPLALALIATAKPGTGGMKKRRWDFLGEVMRRAWFIPLFVGVGLFFSFNAAGSGALMSFAMPVDTVIQSMALASIGLSVNFDSIVDAGTRPLVAGLAGWLFVSLAILAIMIALF